MLLARIDGTIVAATAHPSVKGWRLLICQPLTEDGADTGSPIVAIDNLGAGLHSRVVLSSDGLSVREVVGDPHSPIRYRVIGLVDEEGECA